MFGEAIERAWQILSDNDNTEVLKPYKLKEFIACFKKMASEKSPTKDEYIIERIEPIRISSNGRFEITTQEREVPNKTTTTLIKSKTYSCKDVSTYLAKLRKNNKI